MKQARGSLKLLQVTPDRLELREGGGCLSVFGVPFLAAGVFLTLIGVRIVPMSNAKDVPGWGWPLIVLMGLVFAAVGGGLVFGRRWTILDASQGTILKQWGLLVPMQSERRSLAGYDAVVLRFEAGDSDSAEQYPILLRARSGGTDLRLQSSTQYGDSREGAATIAKVLCLPLVDAVTAHASVLPAEQADASLSEQHTQAIPRGDAARPLRLQSQVRESSRGVEIVLPGPGFHWRKLIGPAISIGALLYLAPEVLRFFRQTHTPDAVQTIFLFLAILIFAVLPLAGVLKALRTASRARTIVTASPEGILIEECGAWRTRTTRLLAAEILGLDYGTAEEAFASGLWDGARRSRSAGREDLPSLGRGVPPWWAAMMRRLVRSRGITVKSRKGLFTFGAGLPDDEIRYLHALIARALSC